MRPALPGLPVEQRQTAEAGVTAAAGGVTGATSSTGTRCGGPGLPIGTALVVCASAWADVPVVLDPAAGQATFAPGPGAAAAGRRAQAGSVAFEVPPDDSGSPADEI